MEYSFLSPTTILFPLVSGEISPPKASHLGLIERKVQKSFSACPNLGLLLRLFTSKFNKRSILLDQICSFQKVCLINTYLCIKLYIITVHKAIYIW